jgi:hypothetical protein
VAKKKPKHVLFNVVLTREQKAELYRRAHASGRNVSEFVRAHLFGERHRLPVQRGEDPKAAV